MQDRHHSDSHDARTGENGLRDSTTAPRMAGAAGRFELPGSEGFSGGAQAASCDFLDSVLALRLRARRTLAAGVLGLLVPSIHGSICLSIP